MKGKVAFLATNGYEDLELWYPMIRLKEAGFDTELIGLNKEPITGKHGYPAQPDIPIKEANPDDYVGVVVPGGTKNPDYLRRDQKILDFVSRINEQKKLVGAICHGGWVLISSKIVKDRKATSYFAIKDDMINAGVIFEDSEVVIDGNLITSRTPEDLPAFMKAIIKFLNEKN